MVLAAVSEVTGPHRHARLVDLEPEQDGLFVALQTGEELVDLFAAERPFEDAKAETTHRCAGGARAQPLLETLKLGDAVAEGAGQPLGRRERLAVFPSQ